SPSTTLVGAGTPGGAPVYGTIGLPTPGTWPAAAITSSSEPAVAMITVGVSVPASKCSASTRCPTTESWVVVNDLSSGTPLGLSRTRPADIASRVSVTTTQPQRARRPTDRGTRPPRPRSWGGRQPAVGRTG